MECKYQRILREDSPHILGGEECSNNNNMYFRTQKSSLRDSNPSIPTHAVLAPRPLKIKDPSLSLLSSEGSDEDPLYLSGEDSPDSDSNICNFNQIKFNTLCNNSFTEEDLETMELQDIFYPDVYRSDSPQYDDVDYNSNPAQLLAFYTQGQISPPNPRRDIFGSPSSNLEDFLPQLGSSPVPILTKVNRLPPSRAGNPLEHVEKDQVEIQESLLNIEKYRNRRFSEPIAWLPVSI
eukprot:TRINITY_DN15227_c0_g1_i1.p1 TRINITY_DN15227_c0_g1~~TRINITY_DN15227_c0_g1_i1.p1  ORF type:complete len:236 (-),score=53.17 TRINITY_DN15227_c0_g1_i1:24-731(-)